MADVPETFRAGVGLLVTREDGRVLAFERADVPDAWQLPQGGIRRGEPLEAAAWRELAEETGLTSTEVELIDSLDLWLGYELPADARSQKTGRGQVHRWFRFTLRPGVDVPPLPAERRGEFKDRRWTSMRRLASETVAFRRPSYSILYAWLAGRLSP